MSVKDKVLQVSAGNNTISSNNLKIAENEQRVFDAGKESEYDMFWDTYQNNGTRTDYTNAFAEGNSGSRWVYGKTYRPKYPLKPKTAATMFYATKLSYETLKEVDFSECTDFYSIFSYGTMSQLGVIDMSKGTRINIAFDQCVSLCTIDKIISSNVTAFVTNTFRDCTKLENLTIEGVIAKNGFNVQWSTLLTKESLLSIINALKDYSGDTSGTEWKVTIGSENYAKLTTEQIQIAINKGWNLE